MQGLALTSRTNLLLDNNNSIYHDRYHEDIAIIQDRQIKGSTFAKGLDRGYY